MKLPNVRATFWKKNGVTYRNKTKIIFDGKCGKCNGIVLMLNPGSCKPQEGEGVIKEEEQELPCNFNNDITIKNVSNCVREAYGNDQLPNYVFIANISEKRDTKSKNLSKEDFREFDHIIDEIKNKIDEHPKQVKWIWIAFGKDSNGKDKETRIKLKELKEKISNQLNELFPDKIIGKGVKYKHPNQRKIKEYAEYKKSIVNEMKSKLYDP